ncbi:MAG: lysylphosphatidylglycerol synthase transmembrane domain-containing protein [Thermomicrobiales bacterium]
MKSWRVIVGLLISAGFLIFAFRGQDFGRIRDALGEVNYWYLVPALALYFAGVGVRAFRWSVLLRPVVRMGTRETLPIVAVGFMANNVLPLRTGEIVRAYVLGRRHGVRKTAALATIAVERLFDGLTLLCFILAATTVVSFTSELQHLTIVAFILFAAVLIGLFLLTFGGSLRDRLLQIVLGPMPAPMADRVERMAESVLSGLGVLTRKTDLVIVAGASVLAWLFEASMYWAMARGFGGDLAESLGIAGTLLTTGVANLATLIPSSPGYVGPFEYGVSLVVNGALDVAKPVALSYAIVVHAALYFPITFWGMFEWWRQHLSLRQVRAAEAEVQLQNGNGAASPAEARPVVGGTPVLAEPGVQPVQQQMTRRGARRR